MAKQRKNSIIFFLFFCICIITIFHSLIQIQQSKTRNSLPAKEKAREERLDKLLSRYYGDYPRGDYYSSMGLDGIDDRYLQQVCAVVPICAVVTVTEGMEDLMDERYLLSCYNQHYGTEETELTREQKCMLLRENPTYLNGWLRGGEMTMEVQEYLYDRTGEYKPELSVKIKAYTPYGNYFRACTGMRLVCFFVPNQKTPPLYSSTSGYGYFVTEGNYLVPMEIAVFEDMVRYGGMSLKEYKKLIRDYYDLSEKRWAILRYMGETIAKPEEGYQEGISLILEEKKKGRKKELYVLASARKLGEEDRVTKLGRLLLEEEGEGYVVTEGSWDKDGTEDSGKAEFPKRIYKLAKEYGYPDGDCVGKMEEEMPYTPIKRP